MEANPIKTITVKQARLLANLTQKQMAERLGVCRDTYRALEANPQNATIIQAMRICEATGFKVDNIIFLPTQSTLSR